MMPQSETDARAREALRTRQGAGARYDAPDAPDAALLLARRGAAFFARKLNELTDAELDGPSARNGFNRRHIISEISLHARAMAVAIRALHGDLTEDEAEWQPNMPMTVTLPARALRFIYTHSQIHLDVEFRDLASAQWSKMVDLNGPTSLRDLPMHRARILWFGALDLNAGALVSSLPAPFLSERTA